MHRVDHYVFLWLTVLTAAVVLLAALSIRQAMTRPKSVKSIKSSQSCSATTCGAIDPVNNPDYNMREVLKNTLLIEQHLSEMNKYCKQCIVKHFLISIALLEEAEWMAGSSRSRYPMLSESLVMYRSAFQKWHGGIDDTATRLAVLETLRVWRREASEIYFPT